MKKDSFAIKEGNHLMFWKEMKSYFDFHGDLISKIIMQYFTSYYYLKIDFNNRLPYNPFISYLIFHISTFMLQRKSTHKIQESVHESFILFAESRYNMVRARPAVRP